MNDKAAGPVASEFAEALRWILVIPAFAVLVLLAFNFTLGFTRWLSDQEGWMFYGMLPVALIILLSNTLASILPCMIAPRKISAVILLAIGYFIGLIVSYERFDLTVLTSRVLMLHALMVYLGLFIVYYLDRLNERNLEAETPDAAS